MYETDNEGNYILYVHTVCIYISSTNGQCVMYMYVLSCVQLYKMCIIQVCVCSVEGTAVSSLTGSQWSIR